MKEGQKKYSEIPREELVTPKNIRDRVEGIFTEAEINPLLKKQESHFGVKRHYVTVLGTEICSKDEEGEYSLTGVMGWHQYTKLILNQKEQIIVRQIGQVDITHIEIFGESGLRKIAETFGL